jgi:hypothetical protein
MEFSSWKYLKYYGCGLSAHAERIHFAPFTFLARTGTALFCTTKPNTTQFSEENLYNRRVFVFPYSFGVVFLQAKKTSVKV